VETKPFSDIAYEQFLAEEKLMGSRCKKCGAVFVPPRPICIKCYGDNIEWLEMRGSGKLCAFTCIAVGPPSMIEEGYTRENPYCSGVVELEEGARVVARIDGIDAKRPETIKIGMPLKTKFLRRGEGSLRKIILAFEPAEGIESP